ncbi:tumor necrosis factor ligand superfamily member 6-like [Stigmatopora argus]
MRQPSSVYVVDSRAGAPRGSRVGVRDGGRRPCPQSFLYMLVSVALCAFILEAVLIFFLHSRQPVQAASFSFSKLGTATEKNASAHTSTPYAPLFKPVARLMDVKDAIHGNGVLSWSRKGNPLVRGMDSNDKSLLVRREGFYFVYSKVSFYVGGGFRHSVMMRTRRHPGGTVTLLEARKYSSLDKRGDVCNSFLGAVFTLHKDDAIFVKVSDPSKIVRVIPYENVFGAFMI